MCAPALAVCEATPSPGILFRSKHSCCQCALLQLLGAAMQLVAMLRAKEVDRLGGGGNEVASTHPTRASHCCSVLALRGVKGRDQGRNGDKGGINGSGIQYHHDLITSAAPRTLHLLNTERAMGLPTTIVQRAVSITAIRAPTPPSPTLYWAAFLGHYRQHSPHPAVPHT